MALPRSVHCCTHESKVGADRYNPTLQKKQCHDRSASVQTTFAFLKSFDSGARCLLVVNIEQNFSFDVVSLINKTK